MKRDGQTDLQTDGRTDELSNTQTLDAQTGERTKNRRTDVEA